MVINNRLSWKEHLVGDQEKPRPDQPAQAESGHLEKTLKVHEQRENKYDGGWDFFTQN
jgi:hypothetical protein